MESSIVGESGPLESYDDIQIVSLSESAREKGTIACHRTTASNFPTCHIKYLLEIFILLPDEQWLGHARAPSARRRAYGLVRKMTVMNALAGVESLSRGRYPLMYIALAPGIRENRGR
jgi:hypothetical protein